MTESVVVECYSGHTYAQEPRALIWQGQRQTVARVLARWRTPEGRAFRVESEELRRFELLYHEAEARWMIQALPVDHSEQPGPSPAGAPPWTATARSGATYAMPPPGTSM